MKLDNLLQRLNVPFVSEGHYHCKAGWLQSDCPFCGRNTNKYHMGWNLRNNYVHCWKCGHHKLNTTLVEYTGLSYAEINAFIKELSNSNLFHNDIKTTGKLELPSGLCDLQEPHRKYLKKRRYDPDKLINDWSIKGIGIHSYLAWRIFIPIDYKQNTVSWTTRSLKDKAKVRYMSASSKQEAINHKHVLYGEDYCGHAVIVHEGAFDAWRTGHGAVATCGVGFTRPQVLKLSKYPIRVICFDNDPAAQTRADELCSLLEPFKGETYNVQLSAKDASEASDKEIKQLRRFLA